MRRSVLLRWATAVVLVVSALLGAGSASASGLTWSAAQIDQQTSIAAPDIDALSCPTATLCVAGDNAGNILTSTDPGGGRAAWSAAAVESGVAGLPWINGLSCPATSLCVAVDQAGDALSATDPTGGATAWTRVPVSATARLTAVACPSTAACVAVSGGARAFSTESPTGPASGWTPETIDPGNDLTAVTCPTVAFCAAADDEGNVLTAPGPAGPWTATHLSSRALMSISCDSGLVCVAADDHGSGWTSSDPTGGAPAWTRSVITTESGTRGVDCEDPSFCVAANDGIEYSADPPAGAPWLTAAPDAAWEPNAVSCVQTSFCAVVGDGEVAVSSSPTTGSWSAPIQIDGTPTLYGVSCPRTTRCYAGDDSGHVFVTNHPTGGAAAWTAPGAVTGQTGDGFFGMACPTVSLCIAGRDEAPIGSSGIGGSGGYTTAPTGSVKGWKPIALLHGPDPVVHGFFDAGCATRRLCAISWDSGQLSISTTPARAKSWRKVATRGQQLGVYCPKTGRCVAPGGSCPTRSFCAVLATVGDGTGNGKLAVSTHPSRGARAWRTIAIDQGHRLTAIACPSSRQCIAVDDGGRILSSSRPATASAWHVADTVPEALEAVSCASSRLCVAVGADGAAVTGATRG